jgi:RNA polymerase sigma-70 factor (ECF subfamily)
VDRPALDCALADLADGDRDAFDTVWEQAAPKVRALVRRLVPDAAEADDVAQNTLCKVFERASEYDPERPAMPWILGIASWEARTSRRRRQRSRETPVAVLPQGFSTAATPETSCIDAELEAALIEVLGALCPVDRETLEVVLGRRGRPDLPAATFRKRVQRAIGRLRLAWGERHDLG